MLRRPQARARWILRRRRGGAPRRERRRALPRAGTSPGRLRRASRSRAACRRRQRPRSRASTSTRSGSCARRRGHGSRARSRCSTHASTDPVPKDPHRRVRITHPFHPRFGEELELLDRQQMWGDDRVYLQVGGNAVMVPAGWTSLVGPDPIVVIGAGRARLRVDDLVELASLLRRLRPPKRSQRASRTRS